jgi:hypothetical protein
MDVREQGYVGWPPVTAARSSPLITDIRLLSLMAGSLSAAVDLG